MGTMIFQKIFLSDKPRVLPAWIMSTSTCSKAALAFRYIKGNAMTKAAMTQPGHVCTIFILNSSKRNLPKGLRRLKIKSRKNPATVGGSTKGNVKIPSTMDFAVLFSLMISLAAPIPRKNVSTVARIPVLREIKRGLQSIVFIRSSIDFHPLYYVLFILKILQIRHL